VADLTAGDSEYKRYLAEIELYEKEFRPWETRGKKILKLYKDANNSNNKVKRFNVLWSNVQTLQPALYARDPHPQAERRFKDADPVGRTASEVLERCLSYTIDCQNYGAVMRQAVSDLLLPGRGIHWHRYEPTISGEGETESLDYEKAIPDYVYWEDFGHSFGRTWEEIEIVWRKVYPNRPKLKARFKEHGAKVPLDHSPRGIKDDKVSDDVKKACVYEIWDKAAGKVSFLSKSYPEMLESLPPELKITGFFPCQRPLFATLTTDSLVPVPDYALYQTQANELEELTSRIDALQKGLKLVGVYDSSAPALANILGEGYENKLVAVDSWSNFSEKGGLEGAVDFLPIKEVIETLVGLYEAREKSKADLYELTGIADIIRGHSDPNETAEAVQTKGRFAVLRISDRQSDVQRFARDGMRILGEIIAENFDLETIKAISGVKLLTQAEKAGIQATLQQEQMQAQMMQQQAQGQPPQEPPPSQVPPQQMELLDEPTWEEVHALLSNQVLREFRIDIETDSTIRTDEDADRQARTEFMAAAGVFMEKVATAAQTTPELLPLSGELLMFGVRSFRSARTLEPHFEDAMKKLKERKPSGNDPAMAKVEAEAQLAREEMELKSQQAEREQAAQAAQERERMQLEDQRSQRDAEREMVLEREKMQNTKEIETLKAHLKMETDLKVAQFQAAQADRDRDANQAAGDKDREVGERTKMEEIKSKERVAKDSAKAKEKAA
jgi:hypothetical protein